MKFQLPNHRLVLALAAAGALGGLSACAGDDVGTTASTATDSTTGDPSTTATTGSTDATETAGTGSESNSQTGTSGETSSTTDPTGSGGEWQPASCFTEWDQVPGLYEDAGELVPCAGVPGGEAILRSLLVLDDVTIDNNGVTMDPCVEALCDDTYAYIGSNQLPHYDFVQTTPNALTENVAIVRVPLAPAEIAGGVEAEPVTVQNGCIDAYDQYLANPGQATNRDPSYLCAANQNDALYLEETLESGVTVTYSKIACLGTVGLVTNGSPVYGPNEAGMPDPWGSPLLAMPDVAGEPYLPDDLMNGAALDLCGGHTAATMHYHGVNEACFEQAEDGSPGQSYVKASQAWDMQAMLEGECTVESGIVGWSLDGFPIKGPCVCMARDGDGLCTEVKRTRSAWVYDGLGAWSDDPDEEAALGIEGSECLEDSECCSGDVEGCDFRCAYVVAEGGGDGTEVKKTCALLDYAWCTHRYVDRSVDPGTAEFVYLDRCNGVDGADGYAYHATASFPYINGCFRGQPVDSVTMGGGMGMDPPKCMQGQMMCCGDGICGGPETADNCPEDC